jgi:hypothetical protein
MILRSKKMILWCRSISLCWRGDLFFFIHFLGILCLIYAKSKVIQLKFFKHFLIRILSFVIIKIICVILLLIEALRKIIFIECNLLTKCIKVNVAIIQRRKLRTLNWKTIVMINVIGDIIAFILLKLLILSLEIKFSSRLREDLLTIKVMLVLWVVCGSILIKLWLLDIITNLRFGKYA